MDTRLFSVYNSARGALLNSTLKIADTAHQPLKLLDQLISGLGLDSESGLWLQPVTSAPLVPRVFPFDFVYLDKNCRVLHAAEIGPGIDFPPYDPEATSALVLPSGRILSSKTAPGDPLVICPAEELETLLAASKPTSAAPGSTDSTISEKPVTPRSTRRKSPPATPDLGFEPPLTPVTLQSPASATGEPAEFLAAASTLLKSADFASTSAPMSAKSSLEQSIQNTHTVAEPATSELASAPSAVPCPSAVASQAIETAQVVEEAGPAAQPTPPGTSISITDIVFDRARVVPPAIVEHHTDPEDLFSNWVVTPSTDTGWVVENGFDSPIPTKPPAQASQRELEPIPAPVFPQPAAAFNKETQPPPAVATPLTSAPPTPTPVEPHAAPPAALPPNRPQTAHRIGVPQISTATTFSATPYTNWQVSMHTAIAPASPSKSPPKPATAAATPSTNSAKPSSARSTAAPPVETAVRAPAAPAPPRPLGDSTKAAPGPSPVPARRSTDRPAETPARPTSAQFVSSVQERLERLQRSNPPGFDPPQAVASSQPIKAFTDKPAPVEPKASTTTLSPAPKPTALPSQPVPPLIARTTTTTSAPPPSDPAPRPRTSAPPIQTKLKTEPPLSTLRSKFKKWLYPGSSPSDRRRAARRYVPGMVAHYFTGGAPNPHSVADISMTGFYLLTDDRWMPGTMIQMTLQKPCATGERKQSIAVLSRVVRRGSDGVATEFVMPGTLDPYSHDVLPSQATDKFALARFL